MQKRCSMSFTVTKPRTRRVQRSELAVPATSTHFFERAASGAADFIFLDLEDAVAPARKPEAREIAIEALNRIDWGSKTLAVRINGLDTEWAHRDIIEIASRCPRLDLVMVPKVGTPFDVRFVDALLTGLEREFPRARPLGIEILIETTLGLANVEDIVQASDRLEAVIFGIGDYSIDLRTCGEIIGASDPRYAVLTDADAHGGRRLHWNDQWHFALARIANACRAPVSYTHLDVYKRQLQGRIRCAWGAVWFGRKPSGDGPDTRATVEWRSLCAASSKAGSMPSC